MQLGAHVLRNALFLAPMAGITDRPFRILARRFGAGLATSEMVSSRPELRGSRKSLLRLAHAGEPGPVSVQIAGADPAWMAEAARDNVERGAQLIDINMGCPAKKVCNVQAGSALLADEPLVARILAAVVAAVDVPVTLKIRTGPNPERRNAVRIARLAEDCGVRLLAIHGRTRACGFGGHAEYDTIAEVKTRLAIPVVANGDIATPAEAHEVLRRTGADGLLARRRPHVRLPLATLARHSHWHPPVDETWRVIRCLGVGKASATDSGHGAKRAWRSANFFSTGGRGAGTSQP